MRVIYSTHAQEKLLLRKVEREDTERVIANPTDQFKDLEHGAIVAVGNLDGRFLVVVYRKLDDSVRVITLYHARKIEKLYSSKIRRKAWERV